MGDLWIESISCLQASVDFSLTLLMDRVLPLVANPAVVGFSEADVNFAVFLTVFSVKTWAAIVLTR